MNVQTVLVLAVGFLVGMIPAMLLVGYFGDRQVEKQRKQLKLQYDRQINALRATVQRLMERIDLLNDEGKQLKRTHQSLQESQNVQQSVFVETNAELIRLKEENERLTAENLRHEGRLDAARIHQERMEAQFSETVLHFTEAERLRKHLLFATDQLRAEKSHKQITRPVLDNQPFTAKEIEATYTSPADLNVGVIEGIDPLYVERLSDSGIHTVADLAGQTPARVAHFAGLSSWDESTQWIAEANALIISTPQTRS